MSAAALAGSVVVAVLVLLAAPGGALAAPAARRAGSAANVAAVTVDFGNGRVVHRNINIEGKISGLDALRQAGFTVQVYGFSGLGGAVCRIDGIGRPADSACLSGGTDYWQYFRNGAYSRQGPTTTQVGDHDQEQWVWGSGGDAPPTTPFAPPSTDAQVTRPPATQPPATHAPAPPARPPPTSSATPPPAAASPATTVGFPPPSARRAEPLSTTTSPDPRSTTAVAPSTGGADSSSSTTAPPGPAAGPSTGGRSADEQAIGPLKPVGTADDTSRSSRWSILGFGLVLAAFAGLIVRARMRNGGSRESGHG